MRADSLTIVLDGILVDAASANISVLDRGLLYGDGLFEVLRTWNGRAVDLDAHLDRLETSARFLKLPMGRQALIDAVQLALGSGAGERRIRIVVTRGPGGLAMPMASAGPGRTIVIVEPLGVQPEEISLAMVDWPLARRAGRGHKTLAYLDHIVAREMARDLGADDAVRLDAVGHVAEGGTCNVFAVRGGVVFAPSDGEPGDASESTGGVLPGIVAARVREACRRIDIPMHVGSLLVEAFLRADEVFVTSSLRGVVGVTRLVAGEVGRDIVSDGERTLPIGQVTQRIRAAYVGEMTGL